MSVRTDIAAHFTSDTLAEQLLNAHRAEVLAEVDERFAAMKLPEYLLGTLNAGSYKDAWQTCRRVVQDMAEEKASAPAPTATPQAAVFDPLPGYLHAIGQAATQYERDLYAAYRQAIAEVARLQGETSTAAPQSPVPAAPELNDRQVRLLDAIRGERGHWKTGRVVRFYQQNDFNAAIRTARFDLAVLRDAGHVTQHDTKGVRFYTYRTKGSRS